MVAEENDTPGGDPGRPGQSEGVGFGGAGRRGEGDLLAERRARRAAESGTDALIHRAEAAEAAMRTLQAHVASLQERLHDAEAERQRLAEQPVVPPAQAAQDPWAGQPEGVGERELRRAMQREYAEQQLRADAEERLRDVEASGRAELQRLRHSLTASEHEAQDLVQELDGVRRQLAEAEQAAAAERVALRRVEGDLTGRVAEIERRAVQFDRGLDAERRARERAEQMIAGMSRGHRLMQGVVGELRDLVARLTAGLAAEAQARSAQAQRVTASAQPRPRTAAPAPGTQASAPPTAQVSAPPGAASASAAASGPQTAASAPPAGRARGEETARGESAEPSEEMAQALAGAVARLRARAREEGSAPVTSRRRTGTACRSSAAGAPRSRAGASRERLGQRA